MQKNNFWKAKRVLVTGANGFVGLKLTESLIGSGAFVFGLVREGGSKHKKRALFEAGHTAEMIEADIHDLSGLEKLCRDKRVDTIFHLAATSIVALAARQPYEAVKNNVLGTLNVLEVARRCGINRTVIASTDKAYGDHAEDVCESLPFVEGYSLRGMDIYSATKVCADTLAQAYTLQYKFPVAVVRCCNIYGPGDVNFTRLIPKSTMLMLSGRPPEIKVGHESVLREYVYVEDAVNGYMFIAQRIEDYYGKEAKNMPKKGNLIHGWAAFNLGSYQIKPGQNVHDFENVKSVTEIIEMLRYELGGNPPVYLPKQPEYVEIPDEYMDSSKLIGMGFKPSVGLKEGIEKSVDWYKKHYDVLKDVMENQYQALNKI